MTRARRRTSPWPALGALTAVLLLGLGAGWAARTVFTPSAVATDAPWALVESRQGSVGSSIMLPVAASWGSNPVGVNYAAGVLTDIQVKPGDQVETSDILYRVNERPIVAASGKIPMFRDITAGDRGRDITQLQDFLIHTKFLATSTPTGTVDAPTLAAIKTWQGSLGVAKTGTITRGEIMFLPRLPLIMRQGPDKLVLGAELAGGENLLAANDPQPTFQLTGSSAQLEKVPESAAVDFTLNEKNYSAMVGERAKNPDTGEMEATLLPTKGAKSICDTHCASVPLENTAPVQGKIVVVPEQEGVVVPISALTSDATGTVAVMSTDGTGHQVTVIQQASGMALVTGIEPGLEVRVPTRATTEAPKEP